MAVIHRTTFEPTKLELLTGWLPTRPWYHGGLGEPKLGKAGGFRLDDPKGEVGIEFMVVRDGSGDAPVSYLVPLTYRAAPLDGADAALVGTAEHGVLGRRWVYDACHDPVAVAELAALLEGRAEPQAQSVSHTPEREVSRALAGEGPLPHGVPCGRGRRGAHRTDRGGRHGAARAAHPAPRPGRRPAGGAGRGGPCRRGVGRAGRHAGAGPDGAAAHPAARAVTTGTQVPRVAGASLG